MAHYDVPGGMLDHVYPPQKPSGGKKRSATKQPKPKFKLGQGVTYAGHRGKITNWSGGIQYDDYGKFYRYKLEMEPGAAWGRVWANESSLKKVTHTRKTAKRPPVKKQPNVIAQINALLRK
jgi:hypothetical protein